MSFYSHILKQKTILFIVSGSALNRGMNTGIENLAWAISKHGCNIHVLAGGTRPTAPEINAPEGVTYHFTGKPENNPLKFIQKFEEIKAEHSPNVVIGWLLNIASLAITSKEKGDNIIFIAHQGQLAPRSLILHWLKKSAKKEISLWNAIKIVISIIQSTTYIDRCVSISKSVEKSVVKQYRINPDKCSVIYRGVDTETFRPLLRERCSRTFKVLYAGKLCAGKGVPELIDSFSLLDFPAQLILCGNGTKTFIKKMKNKSHQIDADVHFMGPQSRDELIHHYNSCDVFVFPSHAEGLGKVIIEAMACKIPVACSNIATFQEIICDKENGLIFEKGKPSSIAESITIFKKDAELRLKCTLNGRRTAEDLFSADNELNSWLELLAHHR